ncbi:succinate dehydrogenase [Panicum miliaceum]|uniref:Succinate dehydrogenase n=1 Tax=Panicum miliaceum TaxID=4540 RepID=A0A3L6T8N9_PANMI|nr:succinate dehydrogenase [Panicum miliaceum]
MLRRTLPALRSVKDGVTDAARQAAKGDAHFPSLRGHPAARVNARESAEGQARLAAAEEERRRGGRPEATTVKEFQVYRWNPDSPGLPFLQSYFVDLAACGPMVLDVLQKIKSEHDSTLAFRRSCREGICGSCSMSIDGVNTVACLKPVDADTSRPSMITPLLPAVQVRGAVAQDQEAAAGRRRAARAPAVAGAAEGAGRAVRVHPVRVLQHGLPVLLVELGGVPRPRRAAARLPLGLRQPRRLRSGAGAGAVGGLGQAVRVQDDQELHRDVPQEPRPRRRHLRPQGPAPAPQGLTRGTRVAAGMSTPALVERRTMSCLACFELVIWE